MLQMFKNTFTKLHHIAFGDLYDRPSTAEKSFHSHAKQASRYFARMRDGGGLGAPD